ncbi:cytochrome c oxidase assembly protein [Virgibacillus dakarensis]|uniref:cytochrome c oxidase assembly protein n=1 Tax=Virgibacillus dakarensis TaxID=1917889 RepID=UPI000B43F808|nr:cytochrome c oxidase assembly protein [Virgibacillus dakarensis]MBT2214979.1 cytochrome c oxidase assembly protein [Virgibacillus dakarensis]MTW84850.1 cytochrome c oxidase assembly protein [Virgibacillus dakarensis]
MNNNHDYHSNGLLFDLIIAILFIVMLVIYIGTAIASSNRNRLRKWPLHRYVFWVIGLLCAAVSVVGPLANHAHVDFKAHMIGHLLLGMLAPLLLALAAPMTLLLRTLKVPAARRLSRLLKSYPVRILNHPIIASILNIGGLWLLYTTDLYILMQQNIFLHLVVHLHVFLAGYLFTVSMIYIDPIPHRFSFIYRSVVLVIALAGHSILSKHIYAEPPNGVSTAQAESGGMLMYYGGDAIDIILITILCLQWFRATRPRPPLAMSTRV